MESVCSQQLDGSTFPRVAARKTVRHLLQLGPAGNGGVRFNQMEFEAPDKFCPTCGCLLPTNGYQKDRFGHVIQDEHGNAEWRPTASLICEACGIDVLPPMPKKPRRKKGAVVAEQEKFDVEMLEIR